MDGKEQASGWQRNLEGEAVLVREKGSDDGVELELLVLSLTEQGLVLPVWLVSFWNSERGTTGRRGWLPAGSGDWMESG